MALLADLGVNTSLRVSIDATAAKGISSRKGLGKVRHIAVSQLWVQDRIRRGDFVLQKVGTEDNLADALTKYVSAEPIRKHGRGWHGHTLRKT